MINILALIAGIKNHAQYYSTLQLLKEIRHTLPDSGKAYAALYNQKQKLKS